MVEIRFFRLMIAFAFVTAMSEAHGLTLEEIRAEMISQPRLDTFEVKVKTSVVVRGQSLEAEASMIAKGPDKLWMEQTSALGRQRTIRNGDRAQSIDLGKGAKQTLKLSDLDGLGMQTSQYVSLFERGRYAPPLSIGAGRWRIDLLPGTDDGVMTRSMTYDAGRKCLTRIEQIGKQSDTTIVDLTYGVVQGRQAVSRIETNLKIDGTSSRILLAYTNFSIPASIVDAIFTIKD